ncbi:MAG: hypothetical protein IPL31_10505 [Saprospiraceae bacterium]|nr:hypothetical protein [Saprospiraceae bacterium]
MIIRKKRIHNLENNVPKKFFGSLIVPSVILNLEEDKELIYKIGFTNKMEIGETLLPASTGRISKFNAEGKEISDKSKPKETKYREIEWCWEQWIGGGQTKRVCDFRFVPYQRWQRKLINPPSIEISIRKKENGNIFITTPQIMLSKENYEAAIHQINLVLELFGSCNLLSPDLIPPLIPHKKLNWQILPPGKRPWAEQRELLMPLLDSIKEQRVRPVIDSRLEDINKLSPDFTASGTNGFQGYIVFGFSDKKIFILESALYGNAIYVFNEEWETLSQKTKAEILQNSHQIERITHSGRRVNWIEKIQKLL